MKVLSEKQKNTLIFLDGRIKHIDRELAKFRDVVKQLIATKRKFEEIKKEIEK